jgi:hypothetical protein
LQKELSAFVNEIKVDTAAVSTFFGRTALQNLSYNDDYGIRVSGTSANNLIYFNTFISNKLGKHISRQLVRAMPLIMEVEGIIGVIIDSITPLPNTMELYGMSPMKSTRFPIISP